MKKNIITNILRTFFALSACFAAGNSNAQSIAGPDTVLVGSTANFSVASTDNKFISYAWEFNGSSLTPIVGNAVPIPNTGANEERFSVAAAATMVYDEKTRAYYGFVSSCSLGFSLPNIQRIDFGTDPHNPSPGTSDLGNPGLAFVTNSGGYFNMQDIKVILNDDGIYHAFINNGGVVHWIFGNGLGQPPTVATRIFTNTSVLGMSMNMAIMKYNNQWYIFTGQTFGPLGLVRLDLGADLSNIPANIPYHSFGTAGYSYLDYLAIIKQNGNWHIKMTSHLSSAALINLNFGPNLLNLNPTVTAMGNIIPSAAPNRGLNFIHTCDTTYMLGLGQDGSVKSFRYPGNNVASTPTVTDMGYMFGGNVAMQQLSPYWYQDTLWGLSASHTNDPTQTVYRLPLVKAAPGALTVKYYNPSVSHTFQNTGVYDVQVYCDQGENRGPHSFCKQVVVTDQINGIMELGMTKGSLSLFPNPAIEELNISSPFSGKGDYVVYNALGQQVYSVHGIVLREKQIVKIRLADLQIAPGLYTVKLNDENGNRYSGRFVKK